MVRLLSVVLVVSSLLALAVGAGGVAAAEPPVSDNLPEEEGLVIQTATAFYSQETHIPESDFVVEVLKIVGEYARVLVVPPPEITDPATLFLKKESGAWKAVNYGTAFESEFFEQYGNPEGWLIP